MTDLTATDHTERDNFIKAICQAGYLTPKMAAFAWDNNWDQAKIWQARAALDGGAVSQQPSSERDIPKPAEVERISDMSVRVRFLSCAEAGRFAAFLAAEKEPK